MRGDGDLVIYDWKEYSGEWDHMGVIINKSLRMTVEGNRQQWGAPRAGGSGFTPSGANKILKGRNATYKWNRAHHFVRVTR